MVFGSTADGSRSSDSDIDLLAEFENNHTPGFAYSRIAEELTAIFKKPVDLHTPASLSKYFRDLVVAEARVVYAEEE
jgi:predicted nucleotidyltransferase